MESLPLCLAEGTFHFPGQPPGSLSPSSRAPVRHFQAPQHSGPHTSASCSLLTFCLLPWLHAGLTVPSISCYSPPLTDSPGHLLSAFFSPCSELFQLPLDAFSLLPTTKTFLSLYHAVEQSCRQSLYCAPWFTHVKHGCQARGSGWG